jgi:hypothetical protein
MPKPPPAPYLGYLQTLEESDVYEILAQHRARTVGETPGAQADAVQVSRIANFNVTAVERLTLTRNELLTIAASAEVVASAKHRLPLMKLATFVDDSRKEGSRLEAIYGVECDYDAGVLSVDDAVTMLANAGIKCLLVTTSRHTPENPRWRVFALTSEALPPERRHGLVARINGVLGGVLALESFTPHQFFYIGRTADAREFRAFEIDGVWIDLLPELDAGAVGPEVPVVEESPEKREARVAKSAAAAANWPVERHRAADALASLDPSYGHAEWMRIGASLHKLSGGLAGDMFDTWSARGANYGGRAATLARWVQFGRMERIGPGTLFHLADEARAARARDVMAVLGPVPEWIRNQARAAAQWGNGEHDEAAQETQRTARPAHDQPEAARAGPQEGLANGASAAGEGLIFKRLSRDELLAQPPVEWLVKHVLPTKGLGAIYGPPRSGKSFLALGLAVAVAEGRDWFGKNTRKRDVVFIALEGQGGLAQRILAWEKHNRRKLPAGLTAITMPFNAADDEHLHAMVATLTSEPVPGAVFIDTFNASAPGIDENSVQEVGRVLNTAKAIQLTIDGMVIFVHHSGKDASRGMRGSSALLGAFDTAIEVSRTEAGERRWTVAKQRDATDSTSARFKLVEIPLGQDSDGDEISSCVVEHNTAPPRKETDNARIMQATLRQLAGESGEPVTVKAWRSKCEPLLKVAGIGSKDSKLKAFNRCKDALIAAGVVEEEDGVVQVLL